MSNVSIRKRVQALVGRPVPWLTVTLLAVVLAYGDGFWLISLRGAVGAIERTQTPFASWLFVSTLMLPVFVVVVVLVLSRARRRYGPLLRKPRTVIAAALAIVALGTMVGVGALVANAAYDYQLQSALLARSQSIHATDVPFQHHHGANAAADTIQERRDTVAAHVRGVEYGGGLLLVTNLVLVGWVVALRGGHLDAAATPRRRRRRSASAPLRAAGPAVATAAATTSVGQPSGV